MSLRLELLGKIACASELLILQAKDGQYGCQELLGPRSYRLRFFGLEHYSVFLNFVPNREKGAQWAPASRPQEHNPDSPISGL